MLGGVTLAHDEGVVDMNGDDDVEIVHGVAEAGVAYGAADEVDRYAVRGRRELCEARIGEQLAPGSANTRCFPHFDCALFGFLARMTTARLCLSLSKKFGAPLRSPASG